MTFDMSRRGATALGIGLPLLQDCRTACFGGGMPALLAWPIAIDAYVTGAFLLVGARAATRGDDDGEPRTGRGWAEVGNDGLLHGRIYFHQGDDSSFVARRKKA